jgi:hypothetical protein
MLARPQAFFAIAATIAMIAAQAMMVLQRAIGYALFQPIARYEARHHSGEHRCRIFWATAANA